MRVVVAPNAFRGGPDAAAVAAAITAGVEAGAPGSAVVRLPLADGGDGTLDTLAELLGARVETASVRDLLGRPATARIAISPEGTAALEMADAAGVRLVAPEERDPFVSSTRGVGEAVRAALELGTREIVLGAGGSGTIDVGAGALAALGARFLDANGTELEATPHGLERVEAVDCRAVERLLRGVPLTVLSDVRTPLVDNLRVYGPQKGVRFETAGRLQAVVVRLAGLGPRRGIDVLHTEWLGAGGGLSGGLRAFAGARVEPGAAYLIRRARLAAQLRGADLLLTAEGRLDSTSGNGKLPLEAARAAAQHGVPAIVLAGAVAWNELPSLPAGVACTAVRADGDTLDGIASAAAEVARQEATRRAQ
jgi:glycerate kinase